MLNNLINSTKSGIIAENEIEVSDVLDKWFNEWQLNGKLTYNGIDNEIVKYSREAQNKILIDLIE